MTKLNLAALLILVVFSWACGLAQGLRFKRKR
jgi:hypothetical protein